MAIVFKLIGNEYNLEFTQVNGSNPISVENFGIEIDQDQPFPMVWWRNNSAESMAHMVTACGYCRNSDLEIDEIAVMDSLEGEVIWILADDNGYFTEQMGRLTYTWRQQAIQEDN